MTSPPIRVLDARTPMRDGVLLASDVVHLDDGERRPALLVRTPYSRASLREAYDYVGLARGGWAVVLQDVRGRIDSEGTFRPFSQEIEDGYDAITWCTQQPWCDGRVAMAGASYNGATQWLAAASGHPALCAIAPSVIGTDLRDHFAYEGGAFQQGFLSGWAIAIAGSGPDPAIAADAVAMVAHWPAALAEPSATTRFGALLPEFASWRSDEDAAWKAADVLLENLALPAWQLSGWYDLFCEGTIDTYLTRSAQGVAQRLVIGPWAHVNLYQQLVGEVDFGPAAHGLSQGLPTQMQEFLRAAVDGAELKTGVSVFVMGDNTWRELGSWPPPSSPYLLPLSGDLSWTHDPAEPVPTHGGRTLMSVLPTPGPIDQRPVQVRNDVVVWTSEPLEADLTVIGTVEASLVLTCSTEQADLVVTVCDVHPDGRSLNVVDGIARTSGEAAVPRRVDVRVGSTAMTFKAGHRIAVAFAASSWPRFDLSPAGDYFLDLSASSVSLPVTEGR